MCVHMGAKPRSCGPGDISAPRCLVLGSLGVLALREVPKPMWHGCGTAPLLTAATPATPAFADQVSVGQRKMVVQLMRRLLQHAGPLCELREQ